MCRWTLHDHQQEDQQQHRRRLHFQAFFDNKHKNKNRRLCEKKERWYRVEMRRFFASYFSSSAAHRCAPLSWLLKYLFVIVFWLFPRELFLLLLLRSPLPSKMRSTFDHMLIWLSCCMCRCMHACIKSKNARRDNDETERKSSIFSIVNKKHIHYVMHQDDDDWSADYCVDWNFSKKTTTHARCRQVTHIFHSDDSENESWLRVLWARMRWKNSLLR